MKAQLKPRAKWGTAIRSCLLAAVGLAALCVSISAGELRVGTAAVNINPPLGIQLAGYYSERGCEGVIDDLYAKAAVFDDGQTKVALVVCDLLSLPRQVVVEARHLIEQQTGIPGAQAMLSATHTHTGPEVARSLTQNPRTAQETSPLVRAYTDGLPKLIARAVAEANAALAPTRVSRGHAQESRLSFNRRFFMRDGTVGWNPGKLNPGIIRPAGPIDPEVGVVYFESPDHKPQLTYVNFAMHPDTTGGTRVSADYMGALSRCLASYKGREMLTLFANGTCGNLNHFNVHWAAAQTSTNEANRLGTILAADVFKAYMELTPLTNTALRCRSEIVQLELARITPEDARTARETQKREREAKFMDQVQAQKVLDVAQRDGKPLEAEVQVVALGEELAWVALPGEVFVELGLSIKAASPFPQTLVVELAGDDLDYIPHRAAYGEGNYEVVSARCAEGSGERLVTTALKLLQELKP